jgi:hypothetical protein
MYNGRQLQGSSNFPSHHTFLQSGLSSGGDELCFEGTGVAGAKDLVTIDS